MNELKLPPKIIEACYTDQFIPEYNSNPLTAALPPVMSFEEAETALQCFPEFHESERRLGPHLKRQCINRLFRYFQPMQKHFEIESRLSTAIRQGYLSRNPLSPRYAGDLQSLYQSIKERDSNFRGINLSPSTSSGFSIIGFSGVGKTTAVKKVLSLYPQLIIHKEFRGERLYHQQISYLKLDTPSDGSIKGLCRSFFMEFDELMGSNTYEKFAYGRNMTLDTMMPRMAQLAKRQSLGLLVIDEIQHLSAANSGGPEKMLNFFVNLVNTIGIPVVLIGTSKAFPILQGEFRQARRSSGQQGGMAWENLKKDKWFSLLMEGLWRYQWTNETAELTPEMIDLFYDKSQGIIDIVIKLFAMSQIKAISLGKNKITPAIIKMAADEGLKFVEPMLKALRSGEKKQIALYEDLLPIDINEFCNNKDANTIDLRNYPSFSQANPTECNEVQSSPIDAKDSFKKQNAKENVSEPFVESIIQRGKSGYDSMKEAGLVINPVSEFLSTEFANA